MKVFHKDGKVNFVDDKNVFVGFDDNRSCCESFGWSLTKKFPTECSEGDNGIDPDGFNFDTKFCKFDEIKGVSMDHGGTVVFRLTKGRHQIFLTLWNFHNGYYGHGFSMECGDKRLQYGTL